VSLDTDPTKKKGEGGFLIHYHKGGKRKRKKAAVTGLSGASNHYGTRKEDDT